MYFESGDESLLDFGTYTYSDAVRAYIAELSASETLPEAFDRELVYELPESSDRWFERIVSNRFFELISNEQRAFIIGDSAYVSEVGRVEVRSYDRNTGTISDVVGRVYPVTITELTKTELRGRGEREECVYATPDGNCNDLRVASKIRTVNLLVFVALEARTINERQKKRTFSRNCKYVDEIANRIHHRGTLGARINEACDSSVPPEQCEGFITQAVNRTERGWADITSPVDWRSFGIYILQDARGNLISEADDEGFFSGPCEVTL